MCLAKWGQICRGGQVFNRLSLRYLASEKTGSRPYVCLVRMSTNDRVESGLCSLYPNCCICVEVGGMCLSSFYSASIAKRLCLVTRQDRFCLMWRLSSDVASDGPRNANDARNEPLVGLVLPAPCFTPQVRCQVPSFPVDNSCSIADVLMTMLQFTVQ
jgi:hypothetical protein